MHDVQGAGRVNVKIRTVSMAQNHKIPFDVDVVVYVVAQGVRARACTRMWSCFLACVDSFTPCSAKQLHVNSASCAVSATPLILKYHAVQDRCRENGHDIRMAESIFPRLLKLNGS